MDIQEAVEQLAEHHIEFPIDETKRWQRFDCPFCGGARSAINYHAGWFICYRCLPDGLSSGGETNKFGDVINSWPVELYAEEISNVCAKVLGKMGKWLHEQQDDVFSEAQGLVWSYVYGEIGDKNDSGRYWDWEATCLDLGQPALLGGYVYKALLGDLLNWATSLRRWKTKNQASGRMDGNTYSSFDISDGSGSKDRTWDYSEESGMMATDRDHTRVAFDKPFDLGPLKRCELSRNGGLHQPGLCEWCDRKHAEASDGFWDRKWLRNGRNRNSLVSESAASQASGTKAMKYAGKLEREDRDSQRADHEGENMIGIPRTHPQKLEAVLKGIQDEVR